MHNHDIILACPMQRAIIPMADACDLCAPTAMRVRASEMQRRYPARAARTRIAIAIERLSDRMQAAPAAREQR